MSIESRSKNCGILFDHWRIYELLGTGSGGNSAVFRLVHTGFDSVQSALKVVSLIEERGNPAQFSESRLQEYEARKEYCKANAAQEVLLMNDLHGRTNIVGYLDHTFRDWQDETGFGCDMLIRMELLKDLRSVLLSGVSFSETEILKLGQDICTALELCHSKHILHRDIKPENIFFNDDGNYKLGDFGISRILSALPSSKATTGVGTPQYWAPEQPYGNYNTTADIYSLGLVLYELSNNGHLPFAASSYVSQEAIQMRMQGCPLPPPQNASPEFTAIILKACAFHPANRYQSTAELSEDLNRLRTNRTWGSYGTSPAAEPTRPAFSPATPVRDPYATTPVLPGRDPYATTPIFPNDGPYTAAPGSYIPRQTPAVPVTHIPPQTPATPPAQKESGSKLLLIVRTVVCTALILLVLGAGLFFALRLRNSDGGSESTPSQQLQSQSPSPSDAPPAATNAAPSTAPTETVIHPAEETVRTLPTSHPYYSCYDPYSEFVLPRSDTHFYAPAELSTLSDQQLVVAYAEIAARHGQSPVDKTLADYFSYMSWFTPTGGTAALNDCELANQTLISTVQKKRSGTLHLSSSRYMCCYDSERDYLLDSHLYYLGSAELKELSKEELIIGRNEIFARHGYIFLSTDLQEYFYAMDWYVPTYLPDDFSYSLFSDAELANISLLNIYSQQLYAYTGPSSNNPYIRYLSNSGFILSQSNNKLLTEADLQGLSDEELYIAENEIYARHGMAFEDENLLHYFLECPWYSVEVAPNHSNRIRLSSTEKANLELIRKYRSSH